MLPKLSQFASWMPKVKSGRGECQEIVMKEPDITKLPVITCWPKDGGPFVTLPVIHTKDPNTGSRNVGMYRMQVFGPTLTGMHWHKHKVSAKHFGEYKKLNKPNAASPLRWEAIRFMLILPRHLCRKMSTSICSPVFYARRRWNW